MGLALSTQGDLDEAVVAYQKAKDLFKAQGKTQEVSKVEQLIQRTSRQTNSMLFGLTRLMLSITGLVMWRYRYQGKAEIEQEIRTYPRLRRLFSI